MSNDAKCEYLIAQFVRDPFRRESRNVGVIVLRNGDVAARFVGESEPGKIDGRTVQWVEHTDIYKHWVDYWREQLQTSNDSPMITRLMANNGGNYNIILGGELTDIGSDSVDQICGFLYGSLVGGTEPIVSSLDDDSESPVVQLKQDMLREFRRIGILSGYASEGVRHAVIADTSILGKATSHTPACFQQNGSMWVMEPVNFAIKDKIRARDHAGYAAGMFQDILARQTNALAVAVVQGSDDDLGSEPVQKILPLLSAYSKLVRWNDRVQREEFLHERSRIAVG